MRRTVPMAAMLAPVPPLAAAQKAHDDPAAVEVVAFEREVEAAIARGDTRAQCDGLHFSSVK